MADRKISATEVIRRLQPRLEPVSGITLYMQPVQDLTIEDRVSRTQYQYTLEDSNEAELAQYVPKLVEKLKVCPELTDVATDQLDSGLRTSLVIDRDTAGRLGLTIATLDDTLYDAFGQRQVSTIFTEVNQYHVILETDPAFAQHPSDLSHIYIVPSGSGQTSGAATTAAASATGSSTGSVASSPTATTSTATLTASAGPNAIPLSAFAHWELVPGPLTINHQGQFPVVTLSFNLANGASPQWCSGCDQSS